jgi:hypothetical protein
LGWFIQILDDVSNVRAFSSAIQFIVFLFLIEKIDISGSEDDAFGNLIFKSFEHAAVAASPPMRANARPMQAAALFCGI